MCWQLLRGCLHGAASQLAFNGIMAPLCSPPPMPLSRFYRLSSELVRAVMLGLDENGVDFSFRCGKGTHLLNCVRERCTCHPTRCMQSCQSCHFWVCDSMVETH